VFTVTVSTSSLAASAAKQANASKRGMSSQKCAPIFIDYGRPGEFPVALYPIPDLGLIVKNSYSLKALARRPTTNSSTRYGLLTVAARA